MALTLLTILMLLLYAWLIAYYHHYWKQTPLFTATDATRHTTISVVIAFRNEAGNIKALLQSLGQQAYDSHHCEFILVDDFSTDDGFALARQYALPNMVLCKTTGEASKSSKKKAIAEGIGRARGELIVTTDADCRFHKQWLATINAFYQQHQPVFIAAPVQYKYKRSLLQIFQALDFMVLQGITAAGISARLHSMCNGANLAYTKKAFDAVGGFDGIDQIATGDDMLLMQKMTERFPEQIAYLKSKTAIVHTTPMHSWRSFLMQRKRWASKTPVYRNWRIVAVLGFVYLLNLLFPVLLLATLFSAEYWRHLFALLFIKTCIEWPFTSAVARFYQEEKLVKWLLPLQPLHMLYTAAIGLASQLGNYEWKGRRTK